MAKIYKASDRIEVRVHDLMFSLSPLTFSQKSELQSHLSAGQVSNDLSEIFKATQKAIKYCVKGVKGLTNADDTEYELSFEGDGNLSDECADDLMNMEYFQSIASMCMAMANNVPEEFMNADGTPLDGVKRVKKPSKKAKGKGKKNPN